MVIARVSSCSSAVQTPARTSVLAYAAKQVMTAMTMMRRLFMTGPSSTKGFVLSTKTFVAGHDCVVPNLGMRHGAAGPYSSVCRSTLMANGGCLFRHDAQLLQLPLRFATLARGHAALLPHQFVGRDGSFVVAGERFSARLVELRVEVRVASSQLVANQSLDGAHAQRAPLINYFAELLAIAANEHGDGQRTGDAEFVDHRGVISADHVEGD